MEPVSIDPIQAKLINILLKKALPYEFSIDTGTNNVVCKIDINKSVITLDKPEPFNIAGSLFILVGNSICKLEMSSLEAIALCPVVADWRGNSKDSVANYLELPEPLCTAILERLFAPVLKKLSILLGCSIDFTTPLSEFKNWYSFLPLVLTLPDGEPIYIRVSWSEEQLVRFLITKFNDLPDKRHFDDNFCKITEFSCPIEVGAMFLSGLEVYNLRQGDILLPESWNYEHPRLILPGGALICRLEEGDLSIIGRDPFYQSSSIDNEDNMDDHSAKDESKETQARVFDQELISSMEIPVTFEIANLNLSIQEIASLVPGYSFKFNGNISNLPILVRICGRVVAKGRFVDIAGNIGVQITENISSRSTEM